MSIKIHGKIKDTLRSRSRGGAFLLMAQCGMLFFLAVQKGCSDRKEYGVWGSLSRR